MNLFRCPQTRMHRAPDCCDQSQARRRLQIRHHGLPHHSRLLHSSIRRTLITFTKDPQHHRGLLAKDQDSHRKLPNETEEDSVLQDKVQDHITAPKERLHHQSMHLQLPRQSRSHEEETRIHR